MPEIVRLPAMLVEGLLTGVELAERVAATEDPGLSVTLPLGGVGDKDNVALPLLLVLNDRDELAEGLPVMLPLSGVGDKDLLSLALSDTLGATEAVTVVVGVTAAVGDKDKVALSDTLGATEAVIVGVGVTRMPKN